jgi:tryptophan 2,3-dioxygenase
MSNSSDSSGTPPEQPAGPPPGCPYHVGSPNVYGESDLTYNDYLKIPELLKLQVPQSEPAHHDELLFIIIHQAYELWFKLILHEMENSIRYMQSKSVLRARHFMKRSVEIMKLLVGQIHILETMTPAEFLQFRDRLMPASGFQSIQYREIEFLAGLKDETYLKHFKNRPDFLEILKKRMTETDLKSAYYHLLWELRGELGATMPKDAAELERAPEISEENKRAIMTAILPIYQQQEKHHALYLLSEALVDFDQYFSLWREHHVRVVERIIGFKQGTGGSTGVGYLRSTTIKKMFPYLWEVRTYLEKN